MAHRADCVMSTVVNVSKSGKQLPNVINCVGIALISVSCRATNRFVGLRLLNCMVENTEHYFFSMCWQSKKENRRQYIILDSSLIKNLSIKRANGPDIFLCEKEIKRYVVITNKTSHRTRQINIKT